MLDKEIALQDALIKKLNVVSRDMANTIVEIGSRQGNGELANDELTRGALRDVVGVIIYDHLSHSLVTALSSVNKFLGDIANAKEEK